MDGEKPCMGNEGEGGGGRCIVGEKGRRGTGERLVSIFSRQHRRGATVGTFF